MPRFFCCPRSPSPDGAPRTRRESDDRHTDRRRAAIDHQRHPGRRATAAGCECRTFDDGHGGTVVGVAARLPCAGLPGVNAVLEKHRPYMLASREGRPHAPTVVKVGSVRIGGGRPVVMAGPCVIESREALLEAATATAAAGADMLRGGAFKPRTSPYAFQGLGEDGLRYLAEARDVTGLPVVTEVMEPEQVDLVARYADMLQIGSRNMANFPLLRRVGQAEQAGPAQARLLGHGRGVADERRVHPGAAATRTSSSASAASAASTPRPASRSI